MTKHLLVPLKKLAGHNVVPLSPFWSKIWPTDYKNRDFGTSPTLKKVNLLLAEK